jgi:hypothetical protein
MAIWPWYGTLMQGGPTMTSGDISRYRIYTNVKRWRWTRKQIAFRAPGDFVKRGKMVNKRPSAMSAWNLPYLGASSCTSATTPPISRLRCPVRTQDKLDAKSAFISKEGEA